MLGRVDVVDAAGRFALGPAAGDLSTLGDGEVLVVGGHRLDVLVAGDRPESRAVGLSIPVQRILVAEPGEEGMIGTGGERFQVHQIDGFGGTHVSSLLASICDCLVTKA